MHIDSSIRGYFVREADLRGDREAVLRLWAHKTTGSALTEDKISWYYESNPDGVGRLFLLYHTDHDGALGVVGVVPRKFLDGKVEFTGGVIVDLVIAPEHRTIGPGLVLQREAINAVSRDVDFTLGFPNRRSRILRERLGYDDKRVFHQFVCPIVIEEYLGDRVPQFLCRVASFFYRSYLAVAWKISRRPSHFRGDFSSDFVDRLWTRAVAKSGRPIGLRRFETVQWRLREHPLQNVEFFCIECSESGDLGYIAFVCLPARKIKVLDIIGSSDLLVRGMCAEFMRYMAGRGAVSIACRVDLKSLPELRCLSRLGFRRRAESYAYLTNYGSGRTPLRLSRVAITGFDGDN